MLICVILLQALFSWAPKSLWMVNTAMKLKEACYLGEKIMTNLDSILKKQKHYVADKDPFSQNYGFSAKNQTRLSDFIFTFHSHALEKEMATHSSILAWRIPGTGEPGGLSSMGSHGVGHDWSNLAAAAAAAAWFFQ